jgi:hypothetical protein
MPARAKRLLLAGPSRTPRHRWAPPSVSSGPSSVVDLGTTFGSTAVVVIPHRHAHRAPLAGGHVDRLRGWGRARSARSRDRRRRGARRTARGPGRSLSPGRRRWANTEGTRCCVEARSLAPPDQFGRSRWTTSDNGGRPGTDDRNPRSNAGVSRLPGRAAGARPWRKPAASAGHARVCPTAGAGGVPLRILQRDLRRVRAWRVLPSLWAVWSSPACGSRFG